MIAIYTERCLSFHTGNKAKGVKRKSNQQAESELLKSWFAAVNSMSVKTLTAEELTNKFLKSLLRQDRADPMIYSSTEFAYSYGISLLPLLHICKNIT